MSALFSTNITKLRREKNISQKQAASGLGISQALLSHYEKGIRECNLDFVKKAAEYYGVTSDYLLGLSEARSSGNEFNDTSDTATDSKTIPLTVLRTMIYLADAAAKNGENAEILFTDYFSLCIKKYLTLQGIDKKNMASLCDIALNGVTAQIGNIYSKSFNDAEKPLTIDTLTSHSEMLMNKALQDII